MRMLWSRRQINTSYVSPDENSKLMLFYAPEYKAVSVDARPRLKLSRQDEQAVEQYSHSIIIDTLILCAMYFLATLAGGKFCRKTHTSSATAMRGMQ